jgi:N-acetyl sugar amidotransferase
MQYCTRCLYPANAKPTISFDEQGVCSGCRYHESRGKVDWGQRWNKLLEIAEEAKRHARMTDAVYDCVIGVSGGKDSSFQVYVAIELLGLNPLLVHYNHRFNTEIGLRNLDWMSKTFPADLIKFNARMDAVRRISRFGFFKTGDVTLHYHAGCITFPMQMAVRYDIPLVIWGEEGFAELTGMFTIDDMVEYTRWKRKEHDMRGMEPEDWIGNEDITLQDIGPYQYPDDGLVENLGLRGIYLSNYMDWDPLEQAQLLVARGWSPNPSARERSFNLFSKIDDHANNLHDWLKYLKFGYGRATDDASQEIRHGRMSRGMGVEMVRRFDSTRPTSLETYLDFLEITEKQFWEVVNDMREPGTWLPSDHYDGWRLADTVVSSFTEFGDGAVSVKRAAVSVEDIGLPYYALTPGTTPPMGEGFKEG